MSVPEQKGDVLKIWKNPSVRPRAPHYLGYVVKDEEKYWLALWPRKFVLRGSVEKIRGEKIGDVTINGRSRENKRKQGYEWHRGGVTVMSEYFAFEMTRVEGQEDTFTATELVRSRRF